MAIQLIRVILELLPLALLVVVIVSSFFRTYGPPQANIILLIFIILIPYEAHLALQFIAVPQLIRGVRLSWVRNINICSLVLAPIMAFYVYICLWGLCSFWGNFGDMEKKSQYCLLSLF